MMIRNFCMLATLVVAMISQAQAGTAWGPFDWGMTKETVLSSFQNVMTSGQMLVLDAGDIEQVPFGAFLTFKGENGGLTEVKLECMDPQITDPQAGAIMKRYRQELGKPASEKNDAFMSITWTGTTNVNLMWAPASEYSPSIMRITYTPAKEAVTGTAQSEATPAGN